MAVRVKRKGTHIREEGVAQIVRDFAQVKKMKAMWEGKEKELRGRVDAIVDAYGEEDDKGHVWYTLPEPVDGVTKIFRQKRVSQTMDEDVAEAVLKDLDLWDQCTRMVCVIDEDAVLALAYKKEISEEQLAEMYEENVSYALYLK